MKVLVIGGGGREHAIVDALARSAQVEKIWCAPGQCGHCGAGRVLGDQGDRGGETARLRSGQRNRPYGRGSGGGAGGGSRRCVQGRRAADLRPDESRRADRIEQGVRQGPDGQIRYSDGGVPRFHGVCRSVGLRGFASASGSVEVRRAGGRQGRGDR